MLIVNLNEKKLKAVPRTNMIQEKIKEKFDLQQYLVNSWEVFKNTIGLPTAFLIGQEIKPHDSVADAIDLLAYNQDDSSLIVFELKRDKNKLHLLQSISYAAMVYSWSKEKLIEIIEVKKAEGYNELLEIISHSELSDEIKIILIAESYDPEVIIASDWLCEKYGVNITAFSIELQKVDENILLDIEQRYPLRELAETYEPRRRIRNETIQENKITWDEIKPKLKYGFGARAIDLCLKYTKGDPERRRFGSIRSNYDGFIRISINFREKYINLYTNISDKEAGSAALRKVFGEQIQLIEWQGGWSLIIENEEMYNKLVEWLKL